MDKKTRKLVTTHKALRSKDDVEKLYMSKEESGLACIEDCADAAIQILEDYIKKSKERLITAANHSIGNIRTEQQELDDCRIRQLQRSKSLQRCPGYDPK